VSSPPKQQILNEGRANNHEINSSYASKNSPEYVMQDIDQSNSFNTK
jgi:hypothetical protein